MALFRHNDRPEPNPGAPTELLGAAAQLSAAIFDQLVLPLKIQSNVPSPQLAAIIGAVAGHAAQVATIRGLTEKSPEFSGLSVATVDGANGEKYLYGDAINRLVMEDEYSIWTLVGGIQQKMGRRIPDLGELVRHVTSTVGTDAFGMPRDLPAGSPDLRARLELWAPWAQYAQTVPNPDHLPLAFGLAYQRFAQTDNEVDPSIDQDAQARIMMESAIAGSKLILAPLDLSAAE